MVMAVPVSSPEAVLSPMSAQTARAASGELSNIPRAFIPWVGNGDYRIPLPRSFGRQKLLKFTVESKNLSEDAYVQIRMRGNCVSLWLFFFFSVNSKLMFCASGTSGCSVNSWQEARPGWHWERKGGRLTGSDERDEAIGARRVMGELEGGDDT